MSQQPEMTSPPMTVSPAPASAAVIDPVPEPPPPRLPVHPVPQRIPRWLERGELFLRVLLRMYIGLAVCYAPWSRMFWDQNPLFLRYPNLGIYAAHGSVRGIITGIGLLNLWIAFRDAVRHRDG
jgi:hypothetical protein